MLSKQNKLIGKLKLECRKQAAQIESILKEKRSVRIRVRENTNMTSVVLTLSCGYKCGNHLSGNNFMSYSKIPNFQLLYKK